MAIAFTYVASFVAYLAADCWTSGGSHGAARRPDSAHYCQAGARRQRQRARQLSNRLCRQPPPYTVEQLALPEAARRSAIFNLNNSGYIIEVLRKLFTRRTEVQNLSGPIGIARETGEAISMPGWQPIIGLMALISLNLGIFNLLPIPILDGGMILLAADRGRASPRSESGVQRAHLSSRVRRHNSLLRICYVQ